MKGAKNQRRGVWGEGEVKVGRDETRWKWGDEENGDEDGW